MKDQGAYLFASQENTTELLISKLSNYKGKASCVIALSNNAVVMAKEVAKKLGAHLLFVPSRQIKDPSGSDGSIGVVSFDYVVTNHSFRDIPQDYIFRQAQRLRSELFSSYPGVHSSIHSRLQNRSVILIDDLVQTSDKILGLLDAVYNQDPREVIVAVPVIAEGAVQPIMKRSSTLFLRIISNHSIENAYLSFNTITDGEVARLLRSTTKRIIEDRGCKPMNRSIRAKYQMQ
jgi:putative phosphoribosyl transferase